MENISFVLWCVLWPVSTTIKDWFLEAKLHRRYSDSVTALAVLLETSVWIYVAALLYKR